MGKLAGGLENRREFLCKLGAAACATSVLPLVAGCEVSEIKTSPPAKGIKFTFDTAVDPYKPLATVGGSAPGDIGTKDKPFGIIMVRTEASKVVAVSSACAHQGIPVGYDAAVKGFKCPFHQAEYQLTGAIKAQPNNGDKITTGLKSYATSFDGKIVTVTT